MKPQQAGLLFDSIHDRYTVTSILLQTEVQIALLPYRYQIMGGLCTLYQDV